MSEFKSCPVCQEQSDQCLPCASYVVDGERIYYEKLKDFGATKDHEIRFINRIQKQRTTAFFHNGKLYIPSRQGRSVPLAIGLQWDAWQEQQAKIDELQKRADYASQEVKGLERFTGEDCIADFEVLQGAVSHACKRLEKTLLGEVTLEPKWTTIKVVCQKCGHYLNGCHCNHFGDQCPHLNTSMFGDNGLAECFNCNKIINKDREVVGDVDDINLTR
jgi:hypothetical protein